MEIIAIVCPPFDIECEVMVMVGRKIATIPNSTPKNMFVYLLVLCVKVRIV